jgi:DNA-directed RNA polymerase subunit N (RpoN/RPB10)
MYPQVRCANCNSSLGEYYNLFILMKNHLYDLELKKNNINIDNGNENTLHTYNNIQYNNINIETKQIFDILNITNYCCKKKMLTNIEFNSLLY